MIRLSVRLPETLYHQLNNMAKSEGISLNQYIVYALTRQVTIAYTVQRVPESEVTQQHASFNDLLKSLGKASFDEIEAVMAEREKVAPERELTPKVLKRLCERLTTD